MLTKNIELMKKEVASHIAADAVVQGTYWENGRGCFIGCLTHSSVPKNVTEKFNMPVALVYVCEHIFENLSPQDAKQFFADIPNAIGSDGKNLDLVVWKFLEAELRSLPEVDAKTQSIIDPVVKGMALLGGGKEWPNSEESHRAAAAFAADAGSFAADAAAYAAFAAAYAYADYAVRAAGAVARAADAAARGGAANAAAFDRAIKRQRDKILDLIKNAPVKA